MAEEIRRVLQASYREEARLLGIDDFPPLRRSLAEIRGSSTLFFGARQGDELVAVAEVDPGGGPGVHIDSLVVHPSAFRLGVGSRLLDDLLDRWAAGPITVSTAKANRPALGLYAKKGFEVIRSWQTGGGIEMVTLTVADSQGQQGL